MLYFTEHFSNTGVGTSDYPANQGWISGGFIGLLPEFTGKFSPLFQFSPKWDVDNSLDTNALASVDCYLSGTVTFTSGGAAFTEAAGDVASYLGFRTYTGSSLSAFSGWLQATGDFTVEVDYYPGDLPMTRWQETTTGLVNPGIFISNGTYAEYLELTNYGIQPLRAYGRYLEFPQGPKQLRIVGSSGQLEIFAGQEGFGIVPFAAAFTGEYSLLFGAIDSSILSGVAGTTGSCYWDNLKVNVTQAIRKSSEQQIWPTGIFSYSWQKSFQNQIYGAQVAYVAGPGGTAELVFYWDSGGSDVILASGVLDPTNKIQWFEFAGWPNVGTELFTKIVHSGNGNGQATLVDSVTIWGTAKNPYLALSPTWKHSNVDQEVRGTILANAFKAGTPYVDQYDVLLFHPTGSYGSVGAGIPNLALDQTEISLTGTANWVSYTPSQQGVANFQIVSGVVNNYWLGGPFAAVSDGSISGALPTGFRVPDAADNSVAQYYEPRSGWKPLEFAERSLTAAKEHYAYTGNEWLLYYHYGAGTSAETLNGVEFALPATLTGEILVEFNTQVLTGTQFIVWLSGNGNLQTQTVPAGLFSTPNKVAITATISNTGSAYFGLGSDGLQETELLVSYAQAYVIERGWFTGALSGTYYETGHFVSGDFPVRAGISLGGNVILHNYPATTGAIFYKENGPQLLLAPDGTLTARLSIAENCWTGAISNKNLRDLTAGPLPLDSMLDIRVVHQVNAFKEFGHRNSEGQTNLSHLAKTNRVYLTINNEIIDYEDLSADWWNFASLTGACGPAVSYTIDSGETFLMASGLLASFDHFRYRRAPSISLEESLIKDSHLVAPRGLQLNQVGPGHEAWASAGSYSATPQFNLIHAWDFGALEAPRGVDWGFAQNHLVFSGNTYWLPGNERNATYFPSGSFALAPYCSTFERMANWTGNFGIEVGAPFGNGELVIGGTVAGQGPVFTMLSGAQETFSITFSGDSLIAQKAGGWSLTATGLTTGNSWNTFALHVNAVGTGAFAQAWINSTSCTTTGYYTGDCSLFYIGKTGDPVASSFRIGGPAGNLYFNELWISVANSGEFPVDLATALSFSADKRNFTADVTDSGSYLGAISWLNNYAGAFKVTTTIPGQRTLALRTNGAADSELPNIMGFQLDPEVPFTEKLGYAYHYPMTGLGLIGRNFSPFRFVNQVPTNAVNICKFETPAFTASETISRIDLGNELSENVVALRRLQGTLTAMSGNFETGVSIATGLPFNTGDYLGQTDWSFPNQVYSPELLVSSVALTHPLLTNPAVGYFYYELSHPVSAPGTYSVAELSGEPTRWLATQNLLRQLIKIQDSEGNLIYPDAFPYDFIFSTYSNEQLAVLEATTGNFDVLGLDGAGDLDSQTFRVMMLSERPTYSDTTSVWITYPAVGAPGYREVYRPVRVMEKANSALIMPGTYSVSGDFNASKFDVVIHGVFSGVVA